MTLSLYQVVLSTYVKGKEDLGNLSSIFHDVINLIVEMSQLIITLPYEIRG